MIVAIAVALAIPWLVHGFRSGSSDAPVLRVADGRLVDAGGHAVQLVGVSRSGSEYACLAGHEVFVGPSDDASIASIAAWGAQVVRLPLNEDCWLGINGVRRAVGGSAYADAIAAYVGRLERHGLGVILDLHWSSAGTRLATGQQVMADASHSPTFWRAVASRFGRDEHVAFELYNEPYGISWACWRNGCTVPASDGRPAWQAAGMVQLIDAVRSTGARNLVLLGGLGHSGDLTQWADYVPPDPAGQVAASWHVYDRQGCPDSGCWSSALSRLRGSPVVVTEFGERDCGGRFVSPLMDWLDAHRVGYIAWAWDTWTGCSGPPLISSYDGTPAHDYGRVVRAHYLERSIH